MCLMKCEECKKTPCECEKEAEVQTYTIKPGSENYKNLVTLTNSGQKIAQLEGDDKVYDIKLSEDASFVLTAQEKISKNHFFCVFDSIDDVLY